MFRKILLSTVAVLGLTFVGTSTADASWRRAYRNGYVTPYYGNAYYAPRRAYRRGYYSAPVTGYYYNSPSYYAPTPYYYGPTYGPVYGSGIGIQTPGFGIYVR